VHSAAPHGTEGHIGHLAVILGLGVLFNISLSGLDDLSAGQGAWIAALAVDGSPIGSEVGDGGCEVHGVCPLGVPDAVACGCARGGLYGLSYWAVGLAHLLEGWMGAGVICAGCPVAHDSHDIRLRDIPELLDISGHVLSSVDANRGASGIKLWCVCHIYLSSSSIVTFSSDNMASLSFLALGSISPRILLSSTLPYLA